MTILALEFSSDRRSVAIAKDGNVLAEAFQTGGRSTRIFGLISEVLAVSGIDRRAVDALAVGLGPGSYTGVRLALSVAQGWHLAEGVPVAGVDAFEALQEEANTRQLSGRLTFALYAQRNEFAVRTLEAGQWQGPAVLEAATVTRARIAAGEQVLGPEIPGWFREQPSPGGITLFPGAGAVARLAGRLGRFGPPEHLEAVYLREASFVKAPPPRPLPDH